MGLFGSNPDRVMKQLIDNAEDAILYTDKNNKISYLNPAALKLFKTTLKESVGKPLDSLALGDVKEGNVEVDWQDGKSLEANMSRISVPGGQGWAVSIKDITRERKAIANSQQVLSQSVNAVVSIDDNNNVTFMNAAAEALWGYRAEEVMGKNVKMLVPKEIQDFHDGYVNKNRTSRVDSIVGTSRDIQLERKDGSRIWANLSLSRIDGEEGTGYTAFARDITKEKTAKDEIEQILRQANDAVVSIDANNNVTFFNPAAEACGVMAPMKCSVTM